ncbi:MAG: hypothetical protein WED59_00155 [Candidatus Woykebacteria bacterium]
MIKSIQINKNRIRKLKNKGIKGFVWTFYDKLLLNVFSIVYYYLNTKIPHPNKVIWVKVAEIEYMLKKDGDLRKWSFPGSIKDGDWDLNYIAFKDQPKIWDKRNGIIEHFTNEVPWRDTIYFKKHHDHLQDVCGCTNIDELVQYYERNIDSLFDKVKSEGFVSEYEKSNVDPLYVHIGRNGEIFYTRDGQHRLSIAVALGIEYLPVRVWWRHKQWQEMRCNLSQRNPIHTKSNLKNHPDLQDIFKNN